MNSILHGRVAADSLALAIIAGGAMLKTALASLVGAPILKLGLYLHGCEQETAEVMAAVVDALPATLRELAILSSRQLTSLPLASMKRLTHLNLAGCEHLVHIGGLAARTRLQTLDLSGCTALTSLTALAALTELTSLNLGRCILLVTIPGVMVLKQLVTLKLNGCESLRGLPSLRALTRLRTLDLSGCQQIIKLPHLPPQLHMLSGYLPPMCRPQPLDARVGVAPCQHLRLGVSQSHPQLRPSQRIGATRTLSPLVELASTQSSGFIAKVGL